MSEHDELHEVTSKAHSPPDKQCQDPKILTWRAPRLLRSGGVLVEMFFFLKTVVWQLYCALVLRGCNCSAVLLLGSSHTTSLLYAWPEALTTKMATDTFQVIRTPLNSDGLWGTGGILFREYCFGEENSLSSAANSVSSARNSVSSRLHTNNRPKGNSLSSVPGTQWAQKTHWVRCLKPYSPKPYSARLRVLGAPHSHGCLCAATVPKGVVKFLLKPMHT